MSKTVVITGANRGIGLSFAKHYRQQTCNVVAVCRAASTALKSLDVEIIENIDVSQEASITELQHALANQSIDLLINNAGILRNEILGRVDYDSITRQFATNALGPLRVTEALLSGLSDGAKIAMITSRMGSIADNTSGGRYGYRMSKAALNMAAMSVAHDVAHRNIAVGIFHPGLVGTDMIGGHGDITPDQAAVRLADGIDALNMENSGGFWHSNGERLPW